MKIKQLLFFAATALFFSFVRKKRRMLKVKINDLEEFKISPDKDLKDLNLIKINQNKYHFLKNNRSYNIEILESDRKNKTFKLLVNGNKYEAVIKDQFDELLHSFGLDAVSGNNKVNEIKAPMPGLVLEISVNIGDQIRKGDPVVTLEAMKMENILKSPTDGKIKAISVKKGVAVEKNQILIIIE